MGFFLGFANLRAMRHANDDTSQQRFTGLSRAFPLFCYETRNSTLSDSIWAPRFLMLFCDFVQIPPKVSWGELWGLERAYLAVRIFQVSRVRDKAGDFCFNYLRQGFFIYGFSREHSPCNFGVRGRRHTKMGRRRAKGVSAVFPSSLVNAFLFFAQNSIRRQEIKQTEI